MSERPAPALLEALALLRAPRGPRLRASDRLPDGVLQLIRIAAGEQDSSNRAALACGESLETMRDAATFYIQQVLFAPESDSFRVLGVDRSADDERIREHYRWLARWLHPDRNADAWEVVFAERVSQAWQDLRTTERRLHYEQAANTPIHAGPSDREAFRDPMGLPPRRSLGEAAPPQRMDLRWLPSAILGSLGIVAVAGLALIVAVRMADNRHENLATVEAPAEISPVRLSGSRADAPKSAAAIASESTAAFPRVDVPAQSPAEPEPPVPPVFNTDIPQVARAQEIPALASTPAPAEPEPEAPAKAVAKPVANPIALPIAKSVVKPVEIPVAKAPSATARKADPAPRPKTLEPAATAVAVAARTPTPVAGGKRAAQAPAPEAPKVGTRDAKRMLSHFSRAYRDGDVSGMRALFSDDALGPRGGVDVIIADYRRVFETSRERSLDVGNVSWFVTGDTLTIIASFNATLTSGRFSRTRRTRGDLRLDLRREKDQWQIYRLQHDERPG